MSNELKTFYFRLEQENFEPVFFAVRAKTVNEAFWRVVDESIAEVCHIEEVINPARPDTFEELI